MSPRRRPEARAPKPNQHERAQRQAVIDNLLGRALRGVLTIPEAALLAEYWRAERQLADKTRRSLADTTRALQRHREAADAEVRRLEERLAELGVDGPSEALSGPVAGEQPSGGERDAGRAGDASDGLTGLRAAADDPASPASLSAPEAA